MAVSLLTLGVAVYVGFVAFVLALMAGAKRADEAAERHARALGAGDDRLAHAKAELRDVRFVRSARPAHGGARVHEPDAVAPVTSPAEQGGSRAGAQNMG